MPAGVRLFRPATLLYVSVLLSGMTLTASRVFAPGDAFGCAGGAGGAADISDRVGLAYAVTFDAQGTRLGAAIIARGPAGWLRWPAEPPPVLTAQSGSPRLVAGGTAGPLWLQYEAATDTVWVGQRGVPLGGANVLLVELGPDGSAARAVGTARVDSALPRMPGACGAPERAEHGAAFERALRTTLERVPIVRAFLEP